MLFSVSAAMLRVRLLSGHEVAIPVIAPVESEFYDVRALKQQLNRLHGMPVRFRQRLFHGADLLPDSAQLDSLTSLDLVLLPYSDVSQAQADDLVSAAETGSSFEAPSHILSLLIYTQSHTLQQQTRNLSSTQLATVSCC